VLAIALEDMEILGGLPIFFQKQAIKGVIDFQEGEMFEVLSYTFNREGFFIEGFVPDFMAPAGNPLFVSPR